MTHQAAYEMVLDNDLRDAQNLSWLFTIFIFFIFALFLVGYLVIPFHSPCSC